MAGISFIFAGPGQGKGVAMAKDAIKCIRRNLKIQKDWKKLGFEKKPELRKIGFNYHVNPRIMEKYKDMLFVWHDPLEMIFEDFPQNKKIRKNFDCFWDEIAVEVSNFTMRENKIHPEIIRFFSQYRHRGVELYCNTQDYKMVDINFRRMITKAFWVRKLFGNRDPDPTLPPIKHIFGLILKYRVDLTSVENDDEEVKHDILPEFLNIDKEACEFYDTLSDIAQATEFDLKHRVRKCAVCGYTHVYHT
jgi:hypothetical protein